MYIIYIYINATFKCHIKKMWYNSLLPMRHLLSTRAQMTHKLTTKPALLMIENLSLFF